MDKWFIYGFSLESLTFIEILKTRWGDAGSVKYDITLIGVY